MTMEFIIIYDKILIYKLQIFYEFTNAILNVFAILVNS